MQRTRGRGFKALREGNPGGTSLFHPMTAGWLSGVRDRDVSQFKTLTTWYRRHPLAPPLIEVPNTHCTMVMCNFIDTHSTHIHTLSRHAPSKPPIICVFPSTRCHDRLLYNIIVTPTFSRGTLCCCCCCTAYSYPCAAGFLCHRGKFNVLLLLVTFYVVVE